MISSNPLWDQLAAAAGLALGPDRHALLYRYLDLLLEVNERMNLTAIRDRAQAEIAHIADSLTLLPFIPPGALLLADVGSGGGLPGIPLAIVRPDLRVTLIESTQKKAAFLTTAAQTLGLGNLIVIPDRAENIAHSRQRETFDIVVSRALAPLNLLAEWCLPLVKKGGRLLAMKATKIQQELPAATKALHILNAGDALVHPVLAPALQGHVIVEIPKLGRSEVKYPRPTAQSKNKPL